VDIAALILWILTAGGGFYLLATWIAKGGARRGSESGGSRFPAPVIFGHFLLAATGLVLWIVYVASDNDTSGWIAFALLAVVALLGFTMLALWIPTYRARGQMPAAEGGVVSAPAERHFPVQIVIGHGLLAASTLVLVLLSVLEVGES
jgi:hypothetical protein